MIASFKGKKYELKGKKCILGQIKEKDLPKFVEWLTDIEVNQYLSGNYSRLTLKDEKKWHSESKKKKDSVAFGIYAFESGKGSKKMRLVGSTSISKIDFYHKNAEFGIVIGDKNYWGRGIGSEAARLMAGFAFGALGLNSIYLTVDTENKAGRKAYKKAGFKKAGILREHAVRETGFSDTIIMDITKREWKK